MRIKVIVTVMMMVLLTSFAVRAEDGFGLGIIVGEPTGVSFKKWLDKEHAIDAAAAWSFSENDSFQFHADYLIHNFNLLKTGSVGGKLPVYFGIGGRLKLESGNNGSGSNDHDSLIGLRIPFGLSYLFAKAPVDLFVEVVPVLDLVPDTDFSLNAAIGARFYFR